jgi:putative phosphoribosyl transferase
MARSNSPRSPFRDRRDAGRQLARVLAGYGGRPDVVVLALPRGGVPVASEVARALDAPLDVVLVRKLGVPGREELAFGALAAGGVRVLNEDLVQRLGIPPRVIAAVTAAERKELQRRRRAYGGHRQPPAVRGRIVILIDDGVATGASLRAALAVLRRARPARIIVAVPVAAPEACTAFGAEVDEVICAWMPEPFHAVGHWYKDFAPPSDGEVRDLLGGSARPRGDGADPGSRSGSPRRC